MATQLKNKTKIKVGLYLVNQSIKDIDISKPEEGNPGIGGTQYNFITMPYYFKNFYSDEVEFIFYANETKFLPEGFSGVKVEDALEALDKADEEGCDILIWRPTPNEEGYEFLRQMVNKNVKVVTWIHNTPPVEMLDQLAEIEKHSRFVCVSQEQLDELRDHPIFYRGVTIFNGFDLRLYTPKEKVQKEKDWVVYVGSLIPSKGFGMLAKVWKQVLAKHPSAKLKVVGSGKLYDRNAKLGVWGFAEEGFENKHIRPYLSDEAGNIHPSVEFLGTLGNEKIHYLQMANVGIVNPTGQTENCPGSALEFQASCTPVVSAATRGLLDTVQHKETGLLGKSEKALVENISHFLSDVERSYAYGKNGIAFVSQKFNHERISKQWMQLFLDVLADKPTKVFPMAQNYTENYKFLRESLRVIKKVLPFLSFIPSLYGFRSKIRKK